MTSRRTAKAFLVLLVVEMMTSSVIAPLELSLSAHGSSVGPEDDAGRGGVLGASDVSGVYGPEQACDGGLTDVPSVPDAPDPEDAVEDGSPSSLMQGSLVDDGRPVLVYFYSDGCYYCGKQSPIIDGLEEELGEQVEFVRIDVGKHPELVDEYQVRSLPTMFLIKGPTRDDMEEFLGLTGEGELLEALVRCLDDWPPSPGPTGPLGDSSGSCDSASDGSWLDSRIDDSLASGMPVFVLFYAEWCGYCQRQKPVVNALEEVYGDGVDFVYVDADENQDDVRRFGVSGYPTMFLVTGKTDARYEYESFVGFKSEEELVEAIDPSQSSEPDGSWLGSRIDDSLASGMPVFVLFYAEWCGYCQRQRPIIDVLEEDYGDSITFVRVDVDENQDDVRRFGVSGYPTMFLVTGKTSDGYEFQDFRGFTPEEELVQAMDPFIAGPVDGDAADPAAVEDISPDLPQTKQHSLGSLAQGPCVEPADDYVVMGSVTFCSGTYNLPDGGLPGVIIAGDDQITITCDGTVLVGSGTGTGISVGAMDDVTIVGCTVESYANGIRLDKTTSSTLENNTVKNMAEECVVLKDASENLVINNTIDGCTLSGIYVESRTRVVQDNEIRENTIKNAWDGVRLYVQGWDIRYNTVANNTISNIDKKGIIIRTGENFLGDLYDNSFLDNNISNAARCFGLRTDYYGRWLRDNTISGNRFTDSQYGVYFEVKTGYDFIRDNQFSHNVFESISNYGVYFEDSVAYDNNFGDTNTLDGNTFYHFHNVTGPIITGQDIDSAADATNIGLVSVIYSRDALIQSSNVSGDREHGVFVWHSNDTVVDSCNVTSNGDSGEEAGIYAYMSNGTLAQGSTISGNRVGVRLHRSNASQIHGNVVTNQVSDCILLNGASGSIVGQNNISHCNYGVHLYGRAGVVEDNLFTENRVSNSVHGFRLYPYGHDVRSNNITGNVITDVSSKGIVLATGGNVLGDVFYNRLLDNNISRAARCISLNTDLYGDWVQNNTIAGNRLTDSTFGLYIDIYPGQDFVRDNLIYDNYFDSTTNARDDSSVYANLWNTSKTPGTNIVGGPYLGGNFWPDYTGTDIDGDGLADTALPYNSGGAILMGGDYLPLIEPVCIPTPEVCDGVDNDCDGLVDEGGTRCVMMVPGVMVSRLVVLPWAVRLALRLIVMILLAVPMIPVMRPTTNASTLLAMGTVTTVLAAPMIPVTR